MDEVGHLAIVINYCAVIDDSPIAHAAARGQDGAGRDETSSAEPSMGRYDSRRMHDGGRLAADCDKRQMQVLAGRIVANANVKVPARQLIEMGKVPDGHAQNIAPDRPCVLRPDGDALKCRAAGKQGVQHHGRLAASADEVHRVSKH